MPAPGRGATIDQQSSDRPTKRCPRCAEDVWAEAGVCRFCGFEFAGAAPADAGTLEPAGADREMPCPNGRHPQAVQKLTGLYASSEIAPALQPPVEPTYRNPWGRWSIGWVGFWTIGCLLATISPQDWNQQLRGWELVWAAFWSWVLVAGWVVLWKMISRSRRHRTFRREHALWEDEIAAWNRSYWCSKCGIVFDPTTGWQITLTVR